MLLSCAHQAVILSDSRPWATPQRAVADISILQILSLKNTGTSLEMRQESMEGPDMSRTKEVQEQQMRQHIEKMKDLLRDDFRLDPEKFASLEEEERFWEQILFMEGIGEHPLSDLLREQGLQIPLPAALDDTQLKAKLWEIINAMAHLGCYLSSTDHLSDRQLYELLWDDILPEPTAVCPGDSGAACHIDILGGCSAEDLELRLKYYADEDERDAWASEFPDYVIPPHEPLPYDRDRHLPQPAFPDATGWAD
jgi:hypothetical protein